MRDRLTSLIFGTVFMLAGACVASAAGRAAPPSDLPHFLQVDDHLYRGGQPTEDGFRQLARLGVKTVISLRAENAAQEQVERQLVESLGMRWVHLPMWAVWRPTGRQVRAFLDAAQAQGPLFVHCRKGEDRTGMLVAVYRVAAQGWTPSEAYQEALALGLTKYNPAAKRLILHHAPWDDARQLASTRLE